MRLLSATKLAALAAGVALALAGCGDDEGSSSNSGVAGNGVDRAFVADMIPHHEGAIDMAELAQERGESTFVKQLADDIISSQREEIATMRREDEALEKAGIERGSLGMPEHMKGMDHDASELKDAKNFDRAFIEMMIPHHQGAVEMVKVELARGEDPELRELAQNISDAQQREIDAMRKHLGDSASSGESMKEGEHGAGHSD